MGNWGPKEIINKHKVQMVSGKLIKGKVIIPYRQIKEDAHMPTIGFDSAIVKLAIKTKEGETKRIIIDGSQYQAACQTIVQQTEATIPSQMIAKDMDITLNISGMEDNLADYGIEPGKDIKEDE